jgi:hypothetical protein
MRWLLAAWLMLACGAPGAEQGATRLSIYIADNHANSFGWFARHASLETPHLLLLVDDHSDAGRAGDSDALREGLRRVRSAEERERRIQDWLANGTVQAFNWIEALMPAPVAEVRWLQPPGTGVAGRRRKQNVARGFLDANLDHRSRESGQLGARYRCVGMADAVAAGDHRPVLATFDLDALAGLAPEAAATRFSELWRLFLKAPRLTAVTFSISRPWLNDDAEAHRLTELALRAALAVENADITFDPFASEGPDHSEKAREWRAKGAEPPRYRVETAPESLRQLLCLHRGRIRSETDVTRWNALLETWSGDAPEWRILAEGSWPSADGVWRLPADTHASLRVECVEGLTPVRVRWLAVEPELTVFNVLPQLHAGKAFTRDASPAVTLATRCLAVRENDAALDAETWKVPSVGGGAWGTVRLSAEVTWRDQGRERRSVTPEIELRLSAPGVGGFRAALSEGFRRPYVFGAGLLLGGPEASAGNDCANFLVAAWRRRGRALPWCNPEQLRRWLVPVARSASPESGVPIPPGSVERGLVVHLGKHVAALWEDRPPRGTLDPEDILVHHLSGKPETLSLRALMKDRGQAFDVYRAPGPGDAALRVVIGGDVILTPETLARDLPPALAAAARESDFAIANLECSPVESAASPLPGAPRKAFVFHCPASDAVAWCRRQGISALTLGNNHAEDAGAEAFLKGLTALKRSLPVAGAGHNLDAALRPVILEKSGVRLALFSVNMVNAAAFPAGPTRPGTLCLPEHAEALAAALQRCRSEQNPQAILVLPHWGREGAREVAGGQREWARWLVEHGADAVVGCGPHCPQERDAWHGRPVFYSTGNLHAHAFGPPGNALRGLVSLEFDSTGAITGSEWMEVP